ncbi:MAG: hypothetical protein WDN46_10285 [Methylocella sp.]
MSALPAGQLAVLKKIAAAQSGDPKARTVTAIGRSTELRAVEAAKLVEVYDEIRSDRSLRLTKAGQEALSNAGS